MTKTDDQRPASTFSTIGRSTAMIDAAEKTTGAGKYTDDLSVPGMLVGKILHSPYPHARIMRIGTSRAEALEGVVAVVTGPDAPNPFGILPVGHAGACTHGILQTFWRMLSTF